MKKTFETSFLESKRGILTLSEKAKEISLLMKTNPYYARKLKEFIDYLDEEAENNKWPLSSLCKRLHENLSNIWFSICSANSLVISRDKQIEIFDLLSTDLEKTSETLDIETPDEFLHFDVQQALFEKKWRDLLRSLKREYPRLDRFESKFRIAETSKRWPDWKRRLINLIVQHNLFLRRDTPDYILKSGFRSFYFFNNSYPLSIPSIRKKYLKCVYDGISSYLKDLKEVNLIIWLSKTHGEGWGTLTYASLDFELPYSDLLVTPSVSWYDIVRGLVLDGDIQNLRPILIDTLSTTGGTLDGVLKRLDELDCKPVAYLSIIDRSTTGLENTKFREGLQIFSLVNRKDLLMTDILEPEILLADANEPSWAAVDLRSDTIMDACVHFDSESQYTKLNEGFIDIISKSFDLRNHKILGKYEIEESEEQLLNVIANALLVYYNSAKQHHHALKDLEGIEFLEYVLEGEQLHCAVLNMIREILSERLAQLQRVTISWSTVQDIFASVASEVMKAKIFELAKQLENMGIGKYTDEELREMARKSYQEMQELHRKEYEELNNEGKARCMRLPQLGFPDIFNEYIRPTKETEKRKIQEAYERFKALNEVYGKRSNS